MRLLLPFFLLVAACGAGAEGSEVLPPACGEPATLVVANDGAIPNRYIVELHADVANPDATIDDLATRHGFVVTTRLPIVKGFVAELAPETLAAVRCERTVQRVDQDRTTNAVL